MHAPQFDEDLDFLRKMWIAERVGWIFLSAVLVAAALGAFGSGLLSQVEVAPPGGAYRVSYGRFERMQSPVTLRVMPGRSNGGVTEVWISSSYLDRVSVKEIVPEPERTVLGAGRILFRFASSGESVAAIRFSLEADNAGAATGELGVDDAHAVTIRQFFYP